MPEPANKEVPRIRHGQYIYGLTLYLHILTYLSKNIYHNYM